MRIGESSVQLNNLRGASRQQDQQVQATLERRDTSSPAFAMEQAKLDFTARDSVALSSQSQKLSQAADGDVVEEFSQELVSERVVNAALEGFSAWQAMSLQGVSAATGGRPVGPAGVTMRVETVVTQQLQQSSLFTALGTVTDEDGNEIRFQLGLHLQSQQQLNAQTEFTMVSRPRTDPLVINFGTASAQLTDATFDFDLNGDGRKERLAQLGSGSGYLVFDKNKNGVADDGGELFGVASGNGFADLAEYDADGNFWIDESDPIFAELSVWVNDENGKGALFSLHELGVGAVYLGASSDDFELVSSMGVPLGNVRAHGIVLMENGDVRTAQQVDLVDLRPAFALQAEAKGIQNLPVPDAAAEAEKKKPAEHVAMTNAAANLARLRAEQEAHQKRIREEDLKPPKSLLEQLLQKMEEERERYREAQMQRERVGRLYQRE